MLIKNNQLQIYIRNLTTIQTIPKYQSTIEHLHLFPIRVDLKENCRDFFNCTNFQSVTNSFAWISNPCLTPSNLKLVVGCKFLHYTLVKLKSTWLQNPQAHKSAVASHEVFRFSVWVSMFDDNSKIKSLYHLVG